MSRLFLVGICRGREHGAERSGAEEALEALGAKTRRR